MHGILQGGYLAWLVENISLDKKEDEDKAYALEVERSLQKKFQDYLVQIYKSN